MRRNNHSHNTRRQHARIRRASGSRGSRNRRNATGLWDAVRSANQRAQSRSNQRRYSRKGMRSIKAAISDGVLEDYRLPFSLLIFRTLIGIVLLFPCFISTLALFEADAVNFGESSYWKQLWHSETQSLFYFVIGIFLMIGWFYSRLLNGFFLYLYVLGHELTHAFFIYLCGGKVSEFKVTKDGGHVVTNKTNILIALSPYFVPFWSVVILTFFLVIKLFYFHPYLEPALYLLVGASWTFHLSWTLWMIPRDQPDLKENGSFFSLTIIYLANVLLLATLLCLAPEGLSFKSYCYQWINLAADYTISIKQWLLSFL